MSKLLISSRNLKTARLVVTTSILTGAVVIFSNCNSSSTDAIVDFETGTTGIDYQQYTPPPDIASQNEDASLTELAEFAWQEFIALNWPAVTNGRGAPDVGQTNGFITASQVGGPTYTPVWQTYWHRNELFPFDTISITPVKPSTSDANPPNYQYKKTYPYGGSGTGNYTLWNNLDEINELGEDVVFAHSTTTSIDSTYQVLYEAKMNFDGANYIYVNGLNDKATRDTLKKNTVNTIAANGVCNADTTKYICLPCGNLATGRQGNIEIKAGWRQLDPTKDTIANYHTQEVIYYINQHREGSEITQVYQNVTMGLVGLHIIHKTETFPDFVYATWEHKANLSSDIVYTEIENTNFGDIANTVNIIDRVHPIPNSISSVNNTVDEYLSSQNSVWQNYKLINVQAKPRDLSTVAGSHTDTINSSYYLSNSVIESNIELQTFTGSLTDSIFDNVIYEGERINMGGCMGCHGNAQNAGTDFNFLIANAPFSNPEFTGTPEPGCPPGPEITPINSWVEVKEFFNNCAVQLNIPSPSAGHGDWWDSCPTDPENYCLFTTGTIYGTKISIPGDSAKSNIIQILRGTSSTGLHMPQGGPYFTSDQITELAIWIQAGCPYDSTGSVNPSTCENCPSDPPVN